MARRRRANLIIAGVINIVAGALFLLCGVCGTVNIMAVISNENSAPTNQSVKLRGRQAAGTPTREMYAEIDNAAPGWKIIETAYAVWTLLLGFGWIVLGICLLMAQNWARWGTVTFAMASFITVFVHVVYDFAFLLPAQKHAHLTLMKQQGVSDVESQGYEMGFQFGSTMNLCFSLLIYGALPLASAILVLIPESRKPRLKYRDEDPDDEHELPAARYDDYWDKGKRDSGGTGGRKRW